MIVWLIKSEDLTSWVLLRRKVSCIQWSTIRYEKIPASVYISVLGTDYNRSVAASKCWTWSTVANTPQFHMKLLACRLAQGTALKLKIKWIPFNLSINCCKSFERLVFAHSEKSKTWHLSTLRKWTEGFCFSISSD